MGCGASKTTSTNGSIGVHNTNGLTQREIDNIPKDLKTDRDTGNRENTAPESQPNSHPPPPPPPPPPLPPTSTITVTETDKSKNEDEENKKNTEETTTKAPPRSLRRQTTVLGVDLPGQDSPFVKRLMQGDLSVQCPSTLKTVRIFVSSTFTDTQHERNWLMEKVYPRLKECCQSKGYDFQVVDMRWGIRDVAQDDHTTTEICLQEVELCKTQSTGPCFLSLMSHKYGYRDFPRKIPEHDFNKLINHIEDEDVKNELLQWFKKDENEVPATYVLQPISAILPGFKSKVSKDQIAAKEKWNAVRLNMHTALALAAAKVLSEKTAEIYRRSVSEAETMNCLSDAPKENVLWYRRIIQDIDEVDVNADEKILRKFKDLTNDVVKDEEAKELLKQLEDEKLKTHLDASNIKEYTVQWHPGKGIDPETNESHRNYLTQFCTVAESHIKTLLQSAINHREKIAEGNPVYQEVMQHTTFCQNKCSIFHGRDDSLKLIKEYLEGPSKAPFVVHGPSGCGKTSLMAMAVRLANEVFDNKAVTIIRFLGTTPDSTTLPNLLISLINQMNLATGEKVLNTSNMVSTCWVTSSVSN